MRKEQVVTEEVINTLKASANDAEVKGLKLLGRAEALRDVTSYLLSKGYKIVKTTEDKPANAIE